MMLVTSKVLMIKMGMLMKIVVAVITMVVIMVVSGIVDVNVCIDNDVGNIEGIDEDSCDSDYYSDYYNGGDYGGPLSPAEPRATSFIAVLLTTRVVWYKFNFLFRLLAGRCLSILSGWTSTSPKTSDWPW